MLTGKQRHFLRGLGHGLKPTVLIGKGGIDDGLLAAIERALLDHELIKLRLGDGAEMDRHEAADTIAAKTKGEVAQVLGHIVLLYRPHPEKPEIELPSPGKPGSKGGKATKPLAPAAKSAKPGAKVHKAGRPAPTRPTAKTGLKKRDRRAD